MKRLDFVFFDAGGGHRSAATALKAVSEQQSRDWEVRLMNLQEVLDSLDVFRKVTGIRMQDIYNRMLAAGWTLGSEYLLPTMHAIIRLYHPTQVRLLAEHWRKERPDLIVSVVPNFNRALFQSIERARVTIPFVTILTDFADYPPHFWMERQDQYLICGTDHAYQQALEAGYRKERVFKVSGMILRPSFYEPIQHNRAEERTKLGLRPDLPTGVILFGGQGSPMMMKIVKSLQAISRELQLILICGRNEKLAGELRSLNGNLPKHVVGFTSEIPYYMSLSDFFIGKAGPGSISEALAMHLPVIIERNSWTLPQERYNADWVIEKQVGVVVPSFSGIGAAVENLLETENLCRYRTNTCALRNSAVFEIPDILDNILKS